MSFRIGRKHASHIYPQRSSALPLLARNFGSGPKNDVALPDSETPILWANIDSVSAWDVGTTYATDDIVFDSGETWISLQDNNTGNDPSSSPAFWTENSVIPITPIATGIVVIQGVLSVENNVAGAEGLLGAILVNGAPLPVPSAIEASFNLEITDGPVPFLAEVTGLPLGVRADIQIELAADTVGGITLVGDGSTIEVREMQAATG